MKIEKVDLLNYLSQREASMIGLWKSVVELESWTDDIQSVNRLAAFLESYLKSSGMTTKLYHYGTAGDSVTAFSGEGKKAPILFLAHMDTVHKPGSFGHNLFKRDRTFVQGPGVYDCKGGIITAIMVIDALMHFGYDERQLRLLISGEEEEAHALSGGKGIDIYLENANNARCAFSCGCGRMSGDVVLTRSGAAVFKVIVHGVSAHAGVDRANGANAIAEAARKVLVIQAMSGLDGVTYNCGRIEGGIGSNTVPDYCEFLFSMRFQTDEQYADAVKKLEMITAENEDHRCRSELIRTAIFRAMEKQPGTDELFGLYRESCEELGFPRPNGISSVNSTGAAYVTMQGIPTLCATGVRGEKYHTTEERAVLSSLKEQAAKIALTILKLDEADAAKEN